MIITRADDLGGAQVHVRDLSVALADRGEEVFLLAGGGGMLFEQAAEKGVFCHKLKHLVHPVRPFKDFIAFVEIRSVLRKIKPDLVSTHSNKAGLLGRLAARSLAIPVVHTSHGFLFSGREHSATGRFYRFAEKIASAAGDKVIAVSESDYCRALNLKIVAADKIALIHNGLPELNPTMTALPQNEPPRLVMVARFTEPKDQATLLKAMSGLQRFSWKLRFVGDGRNLEGVQKLARELGIGDRCDFLGACKNIPQLLSECSVLILSSKREGFPLSILEAMRLGLPVVASDVGGVGEAVVEGETGLLFQAGDVETLRNCLEKLILNPGLRRKMGSEGRKRFLKHFTLDKMVQNTVVLYKEMLDTVH